MAGAFGTLILGLLGDSLHAADNPSRYGSIMGITVLISYIGCLPFFILAGNSYQNTMKVN